MNIVAFNFVLTRLGVRGTRTEEDTKLGVICHISVDPDNASVEIAIRVTIGAI